MRALLLGRRRAALAGLLERSAEEAEVPAEVAESGKQLLEEIRRFATVVRCRHTALSAYFGEAYPAPSCGACDVCLGEVEGVADATVLAQKVLSCVARVEQRFGVEHVSDVLVAGGQRTGAALAPSRAIHIRPVEGPAAQDRDKSDLSARRCRVA